MDLRHFRGWAFFFFEIVGEFIVVFNTVYIYIVYIKICVNFVFVEVIITIVLRPIYCFSIIIISNIFLIIIEIVLPRMN